MSREQVVPNEGNCGCNLGTSHYITLKVCLLCEFFWFQILQIFIFVNIWICSSATAAFCKQEPGQDPVSTVNLTRHICLVFVFELEFFQSICISLYYFFTIFSSCRIFVHRSVTNSQARSSVNSKFPDIFVRYLYLYLYLFKVFVYRYIYLTIFSSCRIFVHRSVIARPGSSVNSKFPGVGNEKEEKLASAFRWIFTWLQDLCI